MQPRDASWWRQDSIGGSLKLLRERHSEAGHRGPFTLHTPRHPSLPVAGLADVLLHALRCLPELEALVMVQSAVCRGLITADFLRKKLPGKRNGRARSVLDLLIPRADSLLEILAHTHFVRAGLKVRMHVELPGVGEVDCLVEDVLAILRLYRAGRFAPDW